MSGGRAIALLFAGFVGVGLPGTAARASVDDVDALIAAVRKEAVQEADFDRERIERFLRERNDQKKLLRDAKKALAAQNARADALRADYEGNEQKLTEYEASLRERAGDLNDLFAIVRQTALSADNVMGGSLVSAEQEGRSAFLTALGKGQTAPSIDEIKRLWTFVLAEISESGKVVRFDATVISPEGSETRKPVTRAGVFNAVSGGAFLRYLPESGKFVQLARQPAGRFLRMARDLEKAGEGVRPMALDPTKGQILAALVRSPDLRERIDQGGPIGYLILVLGAIGLLMVAQRAGALLFAGRAIESQAGAEEASDKNPLGRMQAVAKDLTTDNVDATALRLDEQLGEEASRLNRGLATIAVLAAVSPLLGLLGTVTGMIETFQQITLFGTGDPKIMSGGISQALVTTQLGLAVAIPLVLLHSLLVGRANHLVERLGKFASDIVAAP